jgi:hypothetical protein
LGFVALCIDPYQSIYLGSSSVFNVVQLQAGTGTIGSPAEIESDDVQRLSNLLAAHNPWTSTLTEIEQAALQIAVWEIVGEIGSSLAISGGAIRFANPNSSNQSMTDALTTAAAWLAQPSTTGSLGGTLYWLQNVKSATDLTSSGRQDFLAWTPPPVRITVTNFREAPEPGTLLLLGLGLASMGLRRTR